jgi:putative tryptophan/tyrosine transport system substrate-binding protein
MRRRDLIALLGATAATWPLAARAQAPPVVGFLNPGSADGFKAETAAFRRGLFANGYIEGRNVSIEYRWAAGHYDQLPKLAADLVQRRVSVIAALGSSAPARAAMAVTSTIPIVFQTGADPVEDGLVASMSRPGGNVTGVSRMNVATDAKRLQLLHEVVPNAPVVACLVNPASPRSGSQLQSIQDSARSLGVTLQVVSASSLQDLEAAFSAAVKARAGALLCAADPAFGEMWKQIADLALRRSVPTMSDAGQFVADGGLISYGASLPDSFRQAGDYVGRVLKGEKPAALPVMQPVQFEMAVNLKTAKAINLAIPPAVLALADQVIE